MPDNPLGREPQPIGTSRVYRLTLQGASSGSAVPSLAGHFDGTETFTARLWPGGTYPTSAALSAAWDASVSGNPASVAKPVLLLTVAASAIAGLTPGTYQAEVLADPDELLYRGSIRLVASAGTTPLPRVYCTLDDLLAECSWLEQVEGLAAARAGDFLAERADASRWLERQAMARWRRMAEDQLRRHGAVLPVTPIVPTVGVDDGPWWGDSAIPQTTLQGAEAAFAALLDSAGLMADYAADRDTLRRLAALQALYLILDDQLGSAPGAEDTPLQMMAAKYRRRRAALMPGWVARVDADDDGTPDFELRS